MKWDKIKEKYPKAWGVLLKWMKYLEPDIYRLGRNLYDFFDEQGIYIKVFFDYSVIPKKFTSYWDWEIDVNYEHRCSSDVEEPTRTEAEEKAFEKAFFILEEKLCLQK